ncbi:hypothetical protein VTN77DRAFT_9844 [Rasamsonia byssochlamydoides]|uniref:uncharacterized protein n=1 Tax=Rasamsonia byssochlamydoides TaxID=89139 RepID=UPI0037438284
MAQRRVSDFSCKRVTRTTRTSYDVVLERLNKEIQIKGPANPDALKPSSSTSKDNFTEYFETHSGPSGFIQFHEFDHGQWMRLFNVGSGLKIKRVLLGNPFIAIKMLERDLDTGLHVPVEILLKELDGGRGTEIIYVLPTSLIGSENPDTKLQQAAKELESKLDSLTTYIAF